MGEQFDKQALPDWLQREAKDLVIVAAGLGWATHVAKDSVGIRSPRGNKRWVFTAGRRSTYPYNRIRKEVIRYCDPELLNIASLGHLSKDPTLRSIIDDVMSEQAEKTMVDHTGDEEAERLRRAEEKRQGEQRRQQEQERLEEERAALAAAKPHIVSEKPMTAVRGQKRGKTQAYLSKTTIERTWSDGSKDYKCTECDFHSADRLAPSRHYGNSHSEGKAPEPSTFTAEVPDARHYRPQRRRVDALADVLKQLVEGAEQLSWAEIAEAALSWVHEQSGKGTSLAGEREPLTADETLNRIRMLLDDGTMDAHLQQVAALEQQVVDLGQTVEAERVLREEAEARARRAHETLQTLAELAAAEDEATQAVKAG